MYQSSNIFCHSTHTTRPNTCCPPPHVCDCPCEEENYYCKPSHSSCDCHCSFENSCSSPYHCPKEACNCHDPENHYCRPGMSCTACAPNNCSDMSHALACYIGKKVVICINGTRMGVILCEICGPFVKALAYGCGKTLYINMCKIDDVKISC